MENVSIGKEISMFMENENNGHELLDFIVSGIGITIIALFGLVGNFISVFILTRPQLKSSITWFLLGLTVFDSIFLILNILIYSLISTFTYLDIAENYRNTMNPVDFPYFLYINDTAQTASVYFTISIALERYFVIRWPVESRPYCTYERCRLYSAIVFAFACLYQLQRFIFTPVRVVIDQNILISECPHLLPSSSNETESDIESDDDYEQYFFRWPYMTFIMILPSIVLIILNFLIWQALKEYSEKRQAIKSSSREDKERSITIMLLAVVITFLICQSMFYVMAFLEAFQQCTWESLKFYLIPFDLFFITTNSSVNFLIYCMFGTKFREEFMIYFKRYYPRGRGMEMSESTDRSTKISSTAV